MYLSRSVTGRGLTVVRGRVQIRLKRCWDVLLLLLLLVVLRGRTVYRDRRLHVGPATGAMATTHDLGRTGWTQWSRRRGWIAILLLDLLVVRGTNWPRGRLIVLLLLLLRVGLLGQNGPTTAERYSRGTNPSSWLVLLRILGLLMPTTQRRLWGAVRWNVGGGLDREGVVVFTGMMICDAIYFSGFSFLMSEDERKAIFVCSYFFYGVGRRKKNKKIKLKMMESCTVCASARFVCLCAKMCLERMWGRKFVCSCQS